jgi:hypothetical protein
MSKTAFSFAAVGALLLSASVAQAALVTSAAHPGFAGASSYDFSAYASCTDYPGVGCEPPRTLAGTDIEFTGTPGFNGSALYNSSWGLLDNGDWDEGRNGFLGNNGRNPGDFARLTFASPVSAVGGFFNYVPDEAIGAPFTILVYGAGNVLLESYNIETDAPISTPDGLNEGAFRGIVRASADIVAFEFQNGISVMDDLLYRTGGGGEVSEPATLALLGAGLLGLAAVRRRKAA